MVKPDLAIVNSPAAQPIDMARTELISLLEDAQADSECGWFPFARAGNSNRVAIGDVNGDEVAAREGEPADCLKPPLLTPKRW